MKKLHNSSSGRPGASLFVLAALMLALIFPLSATNTMPSNSKPKPNTFEKPDFAFPKTVQANAAAELDRALASGNDATALRAAIQLDVASSMVDVDSVNSNLRRFAMLADRLKAPYSNLALLLEAQLYATVYGANSYMFNSRTLPLEPLPENVMEWSGEMLKIKIYQLVKKAMASPSVARQTPLSKITPLLKSYDSAVTADFSVLDFMSLKATECLKTIQPKTYRSSTLPFRMPVADTESSSSQITAYSVINDAIERLKADGHTEAEAFFCLEKLRMLSDVPREEFLKQCYERFRTTPYGSRFVVEYQRLLSDEGNERARYDILTQYQRDFPDADEIRLVEQAINELLRVYAYVQIPSAMLPDKPHQLQVRGANLYDYYWLVYAVNSSDDPRNVKYRTLKKAKAPVCTVKVNAPGSSPDIYKTQIELPPLKPGLYAMVPSKSESSDDFLDTSDYQEAQIFRVSDISYIVLENNQDKSTDLYIVYAENGKPVEGVTVNVDQRLVRQKESTFSLVTDKNGKVHLENGDYEFVASHGKSRITGSISRNYLNVKDDKLTTWASVLTDLSIYRPGDKVQFSVISYSEKNLELRVAPDRQISVILNDANHQQVDSLSLVTDKSGRANGEFIIPSSGMLGSWTLIVKDGGKDCDYASIEVADYKTPTFFVTVNEPENTSDGASEIVFHGKATTFAGLPVADAKVSAEVSEQPSWWRRTTNSDTFTTEAVTAPDGSFTIRLPLVDKALRRDMPQLFKLNVAVTDNAGETHRDSRTFSLGNALTIIAGLPDLALVKDSVCKFSISVVDIARRPVQKKVYYRMTDGDKLLREGSFDSPSLSIDMDGIPSGRYQLKFSLSPDMKKVDNCTVKTEMVTFWRESDVRPAVKTMLWLTETSISAPKDAKDIKVKVGSSYDNSWILCTVSTDCEVVDRRWLQVSDGFITVNADLPADAHRLYISFAAMRDFATEQKEVYVVPYNWYEPLRVKTETFRDHIEPGARESWKFRFSYDDVASKDLPVLAVMTDKALNRIEPFKWNFSPRGGLYFHEACSLSAYHMREFSSGDRMNAKEAKGRYLPFEVPVWNTYGYPLYSRTVRRDINIRSGFGLMMASKSASEGIDNYMVDMEETVDSFSGEAAMQASAKGGDSNSDRDLNEVPANVEMRESENPLAFFMPSLSTDDQGIVSIDFTAPAFIGTWQLQVLGYDKEMRTARLVLDAVSAKDVMAKLNAPRFARTGDHLSVSATLFNSSGKPLPIAGRMDFVNPVSGETILSREFEAEDLQPSASRVVTADIVIPSEIDMLAIRVYALSDGNSDGEQTVIPVLPSSQPVTDAKTFYLAPSQDTLSFELPSFPEKARVTLNYCGNPVWDCLTALPSMFVPESVNALAQSYALFGNALANSLLKRNPVLAQALREMADPKNEADSLLVSPLQKHEQLKTVLLNNTPWVNDASSETLRMMSLMQFLEPDKADAVVNAQVKNIVDRQLSDGGWSWCPGMESSPFVTSYVLHIMASLSNLNSLPNIPQKTIRKAFGYMDDFYTDIWKKSGKDNLPLDAMVDYLFKRSSFDGISTSSGFKQLEKATMKQLESNWRHLSIEDKATAAMLLERKGQKQLARIILESVGQFASQSPEKGMWFANLEGSYTTLPILMTARVLQAYAMLEPENPNVDKLRQWLVLTKQTQNWQASRASAEAIGSILSCGTDWATPAGEAEVTLDGTRVELPRQAALTGSFLLNIDASAAAGSELCIRRSGASPAWGGVVAQYVAPIKEVKEASMPELSIRKNIYVIKGSGEMKEVSEGGYEVGDRVRVTLTITSDRSLDYVAVTDPRPACLEPVDQLSGYTGSDGLMYYREVRDASTNLFISRLPKGVYVINYECNVDRAGEYASGSAHAQSQYAPVITAHSAGEEIIVK